MEPKFINEKKEKSNKEENIEKEVDKKQRIRIIEIVLFPKKNFPEAFHNPKRIKRIFLISWLYGVISLEANLLRFNSSIFDFFREWPIQCILRTMVNGLVIVYFSALILKVVSHIFKGKGTYEKVRVITISSALPMIILFFILIIFLRTQSWEDVYMYWIGPLLIFIIWHYYILGLGIKILNNFGPLKVILTILITWFITGITFGFIPLLFPSLFLFNA
ncbi:YIP1 family protein [bacterium]|nr:YIP1 family protein [bacterium]